MKYFKVRESKRFKRVNAADVKASWNKNGNTKVGAMWTFSKLYGNEEFYFPELDDNGGYITGTCGGNCAACMPDCYVAKSYRNDSVSYGHMKNTVAMRRDPMQAARDLSAQIDRAKKKPAICRIDQSGELETFDELTALCWLAEQHKDIQFYVYSKAFELLTPALLSGMVPENLTVLISVWHEYGIEVYNLVKHLPNVKAFVYDDRKFDYAAAGLEIQTYCKAYDESGKMDHSITCDICRKCFNRLNSCKVIGCYDH